MRPIQYLRVVDEAAAMTAGQAQETAYLAGGTTLLDLMKLEVMNPAQLVDVNALPLAQIAAVPGGGLTIGAMVRNSDLAYHPDIQARYPLLSSALLAGASPQIRNMATVGGNLLQRTRCAYFRDPSTACNKRVPGAGCAAMDGLQRTHAILGVSGSCIATHPSDMCVALLALDATIQTRGPHGERTIPMAELHVTPGDHPERETVLAPGELITGVSLPPMTGFTQAPYLKVRDRAAYVFALASAAVALRLEGGFIRAARVALGGVATKPWRAVETEEMLVGKAPSVALFTQAAKAALRQARPRKGNAYKVALAERTIVRALASVRGAS